MEMLEKLSSKALWRYFLEICKIPHPSKREGRLVQYLVDFGKSRGLETISDKAGNVIIRKPATNGMEARPMVAFQSHIDMVCEKNSDVNHNFDEDSIIPFIENGWMKAKGTTLGADNGIGVAAQLALLASDDVEHGPIECLFTVDEETGLTGANALSRDVLKSKVLINLDSEEDGVFCIGCAGGIDTVANFRYKMVGAENGLFFMRVSVGGLIGGHSGEDINKERGNAVQILARYLWTLSKETDVYLAEINGGNLRNALAREAYAVFAVKTGDGNYKERARVLLNIFSDEVSRELPAEKDFFINLESCEQYSEIIDKTVSDRLINALYACHHGVMAMSRDIEGLVETSTNLASVKMADGMIKVETSQRSSVESCKHNIKNRVEALFAVAGAEVSHGDGYPGWKPNPNSAIKDVVVSAYKELCGKETIVRAIHAGLECGLFFEKYPHLDMISIGPTIIGNHSPAERVDIESVDRFWKHLLLILKKM